MRTPRDLDRAVEQRFPGWFGWEGRSLSWHAGYVLWVLGIGITASFVLFLTGSPESAWSIAATTCGCAFGVLLHLYARLRDGG